MSELNMYAYCYTAKKQQGDTYIVTSGIWACNAVSIEEANGFAIATAEKELPREEGYENHRTATFQFRDIDVANYLRTKGYKVTK